MVLANGSVVAVDGWQDRVGALVEGWLGGQAGGSAVADVLLGAVNPSGRLAETMPVRLQDTASYRNFPGDDRHVRYGEGLFIGYRHHDAIDGPVSHPFGHGLSYTTFAYDDLVVDARDEPVVDGLDAAGGVGWRGAPRVAVTLRVTNTGLVAGKEVVQLYVGAPDASVTRPVRELKDFAKVALGPGESVGVSFTLDERDLSYWSTRTDGWVLEPGTFEIAVGASSRDLRLTASIDIAGPPIAYPLDRSSTLAEWLEHPVGHEILLDVLRHSPAGDLSAMTEDPERVRMLGSFPMTRLATLLAPAVDGGIVDQLLARLDP
ncbi:MAG: glycoside hydrolase family 3 domain protein [Ilumatobacteraceae bacterium]|nr:glycoside hydrolase family 3 domain protein [Ilumatobacteraceae bacterium]